MSKTVRKKDSVSKDVYYVLSRFIFQLFSDLFENMSCINQSGECSTRVRICKAAFTRQTNVGQLVLTNSNWCV